ncbi:MAG: NUDIX domain-containing protein [Candidatus Eiseniibacteriota bacterium]
MGAHPLFEVALKAFLVRDGKLLMVRERDGQALWELPGGRIGAGEEERSAADVLAREVAEELGPGLRYELEGPVVSWSRTPAGTARTHWAFLVGYLCRYVDGDISLSEEHSEHAWVDRESWRTLRPLAPGFDHALTEFWRRRG